jgi:hypothetical protein
LIDLTMLIGNIHCFENPTIPTSPCYSVTHYERLVFSMLRWTVIYVTISMVHNDIYYFLTVLFNVIVKSHVPFPNLTNCVSVWFWHPSMVSPRSPCLPWAPCGHDDPAIPWLPLYPRGPLIVLSCKEDFNYC